MSSDEQTVAQYNAARSMRFYEIHRDYILAKRFEKRQSERRTQRVEMLCLLKNSVTDVYAQIKIDELLTRPDIGTLNKSSFERMVARITSPQVDKAPTKPSAIEKLHTARAQLMDPARIAKIDQLLSTPDAIAAMKPTKLNKLLLDILLGK